MFFDSGFVCKSSSMCASLACALVYMCMCVYRCVCMRVCQLMDDHLDNHQRCKTDREKYTQSKGLGPDHPGNCPQGDTLVTSGQTGNAHMHTMVEFLVCTQTAQEGMSNIQAKKGKARTDKGLGFQF